MLCIENAEIAGTLIALSVPALAFADRAVEPAAPKPAAELAALKPFARVWSCNEVVKNDDGKDVKVTSEWKCRLNKSP